MKLLNAKNEMIKTKEELLKVRNEILEKNNKTLLSLNDNFYNTDTIIKWIKYWSIINKSYKYIRNKYSSKFRSPFSVINSNFTNENSIRLLSWLDIYSFQYKKFNKINQYLVYSKNGFKNTIKIPGYEEINKLKNILKNTEWKLVL